MHPIVLTLTRVIRAHGAHYDAGRHDQAARLSHKARRVATSNRMLAFRRYWTKGFLARNRYGNPLPQQRFQAPMAPKRPYGLRRALA
jgi:hypothetical protein